MKVQIKKGDCLADDNFNNNAKYYVIPHICNNRGGWGRGFVVALSSKWKKPELQYRKWYEDKNYYTPFDLGEIQIVELDVATENIDVVNMVAQKDFKPLAYKSKFSLGNTTPLNIPNINYSSLYECLLRMKIAYKNHENVEFHAPMFGSGLAGGNKEKIEDIVNSVFEDSPFPFYMYQFE